MKGKFRLVVWVLIAVLLLLTVVSLQTGYAQLSLGDFFDAKDSVNSQIAHLRTVRTLSMILCGVAVPTSGFLLQEYFQNPLAGPSVLGITSVAGLAVAVYIFAAKDWALSSFLQSSFISLSAFGGSLALMFLLLAYS
ncbi:MAG: iron ABC transporter permease, partial [Chryseobacterium sp.]